MELSICHFKVETFQQLWVFDGFSTKESNEIETRGPFCPPSPLGELGIGGSSLWSKGLERGQ